MARKRAFISFDYDHDEGAKIMLAVQAKFPDSPFDFTDASVREHLTGGKKKCGVECRRGNRTLRSTHSHRNRSGG